VQFAVSYEEAEELYKENVSPSSPLFASAHLNLAIFLAFLRQTAILDFSWMVNRRYSFRWVRRSRDENFEVESYKSVLWK
jgi:hypothetical protein